MADSSGLSTATSLLPSLPPPLALSRGVSAAVTPSEFEKARKVKSLGVDLSKMPPPFTLGGIPEKAPLPPPPTGMNYNHYYHHLTVPHVKQLWNQDEEEAKKPITNVIVTICGNDGSSYDDNFVRIKPHAQEGRAAVYRLTYNAIPYLVKLYAGESIADYKYAIELHKLYTTFTGEGMNAADVVFYWECCGGCGCGHGTQYSFTKSHIELMHILLGSGIMVMVADFSLKALITSWNTDYFGPCPFKNIGEVSGQFTLAFENETLIASKSAQMQVLGKVAEKNTVNVTAMGGTIVYTVEVPEETKAYEHEVLTVVTSGLTASTPLCKTVDGKHEGTAGQVMLKYPSGGVLFCSNGHFKELARIDTSIARLLQVAAQEVGVGYSDAVGAEIDATPEAYRQKTVQTILTRLVSAAPPCQRSQSDAVYENKNRNKSAVYENKNRNKSV
jgi:hypothetical protein